MKMFHVLRITLLFPDERTSNKPFRESREMAPSISKVVYLFSKRKYERKIQKINSQRNRY